eukprot:Skav236548  [mRNA]  locus=scaffold1774:239151:242270:+ [translate_table: standard]
MLSFSRKWSDRQQLALATASTPTAIVRRSGTCRQVTIHFPASRPIAQALSLVKAIVDAWTAQEAVDALECLASWNLRPVAVLDRLDSILEDRQVELKYTGNVALWIVATCSLASLRYREGSWPRLALELATEKVFLEKVPLREQCELLRGFAQLSLFDARAFRSGIACVEGHSSQEISTVLMSFAQSHFFHEEAAAMAVFDALYNLILGMLKD